MRDDFFDRISIGMTAKDRHDLFPDSVEESKTDRSALIESSSPRRSSVAQKIT
jgi:hypothetical protein